jgi:predicted phosphodiesterase
MRYAILSDVHGNLPALEAVRNDLDTRQVDTVIYLGDAVGYYADSQRVIQTLRELVLPHPVQTFERERQNHNAPTTMPLWVTGNHEWMLLDRIRQQQANDIAGETLRRTREELEHDGDVMAFLKNLPERIEVELGGSHSLLLVTVVHATTVDPAGTRGQRSYLDSPSAAASAADISPFQICLVGHTHVPQVFYEETPPGFSFPQWKRMFIADIHLYHPPGKPYTFQHQRLILNPGSVGQPRDGDNRASYAILDTDERTFTIYRVPYEFREAQRRTRDWIQPWLNGISDDERQKVERFLIDRLETAVG